MVFEKKEIDEENDIRYQYRFPTLAIYLLVELNKKFELKEQEAKSPDENMQVFIHNPQDKNKVHLCEIKRFGNSVSVVENQPEVIPKSY